MTYAIGAITYRNGQRYAQINYFKKLAELAVERDVTFFVFGVGDVDLANKRIHGLIYAPQKQKWVRKWMPYPHIVYDHVRYHPTAQFKQYRQLRESGLMRFSYNGYAHKLIVIAHLQSFPELAPYMPTTEKVERFSDFATFVADGPTIVKPINGTGGRDIYKVEKSGERYTIEGKGMARDTISRTELRRWLERLQQQERYMMQRWMPIRYNGRTCDTRVLIQKNGEGLWSYTGMGTRIGRAHNIAANLAKGASAIRTEHFIERYLHRDPTPIVAEIERVSLMIAQRLEERFGNFVEFGLDIGILPDGSFQLIEANSKPDRKIFLRTNQPEQAKQAIQKPLEYHLHLCKKQDELRT